MTMIEFILATAILVGKADIGPDKVLYQVLTDDEQIVEIIETEPTTFDKN